MDISATTVKKLIGLTVMITRVRVAMGDSTEDISEDITELALTTESESELLLALQDLKARAEGKSMAESARAAEYLASIE